MPVLGVNAVTRDDPFGSGVTIFNFWESVDMAPRCSRYSSQVWIIPISSFPGKWYRVGGAEGSRERKQVFFSFLLFKILLCDHLAWVSCFSHSFQESISFVPILGTKERKFPFYNLGSSLELIAHVPPPSHKFGQNEINGGCIWDGAAHQVPVGSHSHTTTPLPLIMKW